MIGLLFALSGCEQYFSARATLQDTLGPALCSQPPGVYTYVFDAQGDGYTAEEIEAIEVLKRSNCPDILARQFADE